jgi:hypothetical protein
MLMFIMQLLNATMFRNLAFFSQPSSRVLCVSESFHDLSHSFNTIIKFGKLTILIKPQQLKYIKCCI